MCGVFGVFSEDGGVKKELIERGVAALDHRGPDARGFYVDETGRAGLGHARLSIIDLDTGDQPISNEANDVHVVVNGELYGFEETRAELESRGHAFRTKSDSEIVLHLYEELGVHCLEKLRGEFAFVLWDERRQRLFAARDRFGIKPLFFARHAGRMMFGSEIKALFAAGMPARWDHAAFFESFCAQLPLPASDTLFSGVEQVPPGHFMLVEPGRARTERYWDIDFAPEGAGEGSLEALEARLEDAVRVRLRADVPVGVYLSGGIDSSTVLGLATRHAATSLDAFTIGFDGAEEDETEHARRMAEHAGARFHRLSVTMDALGDAFSDAVAHSECAHDNPNGTAKFLLSRFVRDAGLKVVLVGEGADELFCGYAWLVNDLLAEDLGRPDASELVHKMGAQAVSILSGISATRMFGARNPAVKRVTRSLGFLPSYLAISLALQLRPQSRAMMRADARAPFEGLELTDRIMNALDIAGGMRGRPKCRQGAYVQMKTYFVNYNLNVLGDRMEMSHSIEGRLPFLDHPFAEAAARLPPEMLYEEGLDKAPIRRLARAIVPKENIERPKWAFMAPDLVEDTSRFGQLLNDTLNSKALDEHPLLDKVGVMKLLDSMKSMPFARSRIACSVLSALILSERFSVSA